MWPGSLPPRIACRLCTKRAFARLFGAASPSRIFAGRPWDSRLWTRVYRPRHLIIPGTTDAADEMVRHLRHRQPLRQSERQWLDIEMTGWPAGRALDLKEFPIPGEVTDSDRARWWWR